jgi:MoaA/NifB/PqqE/SkfB family radical SAM enzyme
MVIGKKILKKRPWRLFQVESAIACNLKCIMCPWREMAKNVENRGIMSQTTWQAIRPHLDRVQSVDFTGGGEPLLQPKLAEWIADATKAGCETGFLSNGLLLTEEKLKKILAAGINWICISMDGATAEMYHKIRVGSNFERVCENVANIARLRTGNIPKTMINFVLMDVELQTMRCYSWPGGKRIRTFCFRGIQGNSPAAEIVKKSPPPGQKIKGRDHRVCVYPAGIARVRAGSAGLPVCRV